MRRKDMLDRVANRSGMKKKDIRPVLDAVLSEIAEALAKGQDVNLPPLGKLKVRKVKQQENAQVTILRLRQPKST